MSEETFSLQPANPGFKPKDDLVERTAMSGYLGLLNDPELELLKGAEPTEIFSKEQPAIIPSPVAQVAKIVASNPPLMTRPIGQCILFSGRLGAGKDYIAEKIGATLIGFADPLYKIASYFFGVEVTSTKGKDLPGMRDFLQKLGQFGRGEVNEKYPYSIARATFVQMIRVLGPRIDPLVEWTRYGLDQDIWIKSCVKRAEDLREPGKRLAITNGRFENELTFFRAIPEWSHYHVMCSPETLQERWKKKGFTPQSKEVTDLTEQLAIGLDRDVMQRLAKGGTSKLMVVWNDSKPCPSPRLYTLQEFLQACMG